MEATTGVQEPPGVEFPVMVERRGSVVSMAADASGWGAPRLPRYGGLRRSRSVTPIRGGPSSSMGAVTTRRAGLLLAFGGWRPGTLPGSLQCLRHTFWSCHTASPGKTGGLCRPHTVPHWLSFQTRRWREVKAARPPARGRGSYASGHSEGPVVFPLPERNQLALRVREDRDQRALPEGGARKGEGEVHLRGECEPAKKEGAKDRPGRGVSQGARPPSRGPGLVGRVGPRGPG